MNTDLQLSCRLALRKRAASGGAIAKTLAGLGSMLKGTAKLGVSAAKDIAKFSLENLFGSAKVAIPAGGILTAWLAYKVLSPKAVADNVADYAMNATEKESVVQSIRDLEDQQLASQMSTSRQKYHDQFL